MSEGSTTVSTETLIHEPHAAAAGREKARQER